MITKVPAIAVNAAPIPKERIFTRSRRIPISIAAIRFWAAARIALPRYVLVRKNWIINVVRSTKTNVMIYFSLNGMPNIVICPSRYLTLLKSAFHASNAEFSMKIERPKKINRDVKTISVIDEDLSIILCTMNL